MPLASKVLNVLLAKLCSAQLTFVPGDGLMLCRGKHLQHACLDQVRDELSRAHTKKQSLGLSCLSLNR